MSPLHLFSLICKSLTVYGVNSEYKSWAHLVNYVETVIQNYGEKYKIIFG